MHWKEDKTNRVKVRIGMREENFISQGENGQGGLVQYSGTYKYK